MCNEDKEAGMTALLAHALNLMEHACLSLKVEPRLTNLSNPNPIGPLRSKFASISNGTHPKAHASRYK